MFNIAKYDAHQQLGTRIYSLSTRSRNAGLVDLSLKLSSILYNRDGHYNIVAQNNYAESLIKTGKYEEALKILRKITEDS